MKFKVVNPGPLDNPFAGDMLKRIGAEYVQQPCWSEEDLLELTRSADALIVSPLDLPYSRGVIGRLKKCRVISNMGVGYDRIDVHAATDCGVCVCYVPDYCMDEVAEQTMALILACARQTLAIDRTMREGKPAKIQPPWIDRPLFKLRGQTLGLVGFGRIGRTVVRKAQGFGLKVIAYDPYILPSSVMGYDVELVRSLRQLLGRSDFVSLHVPLTKETTRMFSTRQFKAMKPTAYLINTARGPVVDEEALYAALSEGGIAGAGLDLLEPEFNPENHLLKLDNVVYTGHTAFYSETSGPELRKRATEGVVRVLQGKWPQNCINPEVKKKFIARWSKTP